MRLSALALVLVTVGLCVDAAGVEPEPQIASTLGQGPPPGDICMENVRVSPVWLETAHPYCDRTPVGPDAELPSLCFSHVFDEADADFISLHFSGIDIASQDRLDIVFAGEETLRLDGARLRGIEEGWTPWLPGGSATVLVYAHDPSDAFGFRIDGIASAAACSSRWWPYVLGVCGDDGRENVRCFSEWVKTKSRPVVMLQLPGGSATGFLCSPSGHILTNEHVVNDAFQAADITVWFGYETEDCSSPTQVYDQTTDGLDFIEADSDLDYCLLKLSTGSSTMTVHEIVSYYGYLDLDVSDVVDAQDVMVPQHPGGGPKVVSYAGAEITHASSPWPYGDYFQHTADTEGGASGSPLIDTSSGLVVGIHHYGWCHEDWPSPFDNMGTSSSRILPLIEDVIYLPGQVDCYGPLSGAYDLYPMPFMWYSALEATEYQVEIDDNDSFTSPIGQTVPDTFDDVEVLEVELGPGDYFWRVRSGNSHGYGDWSTPEEGFTILPSATSIQVSMSLSPSTVEPGEPVIASGNATYDSGEPVAAGTATVSVTGGEWTAPLNENGQFSCEITAPTDPGDYLVTVSVSDGELPNPGTDSEWLTVEDYGSSTCWEFNYSKTCKDIAVLDCDFSCYDVTPTFRTTDDRARVISVYDMPGGPCWLTSKWRWYAPDGSQYHYFVGDPWYADCDPGFSWKSRAVAGAAMSHMEGVWTIKHYLAVLAGDFEHVMTTNFVLRYDLTQHVMCKGVQGEDPNQWEPMDPTNTFTQQDAAAYAWFRLDEVAEDVPLKWRFIEPNGSLYGDEATRTVVDPEDEGHPYWDWYKAWAWKSINGHAAADKCGRWRVDVLAQDIDGSWDLLYQDEFLLVEDPNVDPTASLSVVPAMPLAGETFQLRCEASDNTYLEKVVLYWNDGTLHSEEQDNIFASSTVLSKTIGPYPEEQTVEFYARAYDTSGNVFETQRYYVTPGDTDTEGPEITSVSVVEFGGNGDGLIQSNEEVLISCVVDDPSGVGSVAFSVDGTGVALGGDYYSVCGPFDVGDHAAQIEACDADNSPACSTADMVFEVYASGPQVIHVSTAGNDTTGTGSYNSPLATIQHGLDTAAPGDTVLVHAGVYYEHDVVLKSGVCLASETGLADCVTIDAQTQGRVFYCSSVDSSASVIGFTVTGGRVSSIDIGGGGMCCDNSSVVVTNCAFSGNHSTFCGGGMYCRNLSSPTLTDCTFSGNQSDWGGGVYCRDSSPSFTGCAFLSNDGNDGAGMYCYNSSPTLTGCEFLGNDGSYGAGLRCHNFSSPVLTGCTFTDNVGSSGGGVSCMDSSSPMLTDCTFSGNTAYFGGGMHCDNSSSPTLADCTFEANSVSGDGGGILCQGASSPSLTGCTFADNGARYGGGIYCEESMPTLEGCAFLSNTASWGGGMFCEYCYISPLTLTDCTFLGNNSSSRGGGIYCEGSSLTLTGCTFSGNQSEYGGMFSLTASSPTLTGCTFSSNEATALGGGIYCAYSSSPTLENCIIAFSSSGEAVYCDDNGSDPALACCDIYGNMGGDWVDCIADQYGDNGNIAADPLFCNAVEGDFTLRSDSPCSTAACGLMGAYDVGCAPPQTIHVSTAGSDTTGTGSFVSPFATVQHGVDTAAPGDTVLVHVGVYYEHDITLKSGVCLTSETGHADCVTIDAESQGRGFYCNGVDSTASVVGFTVTGGLSGNGGGMHLTNSSPKLMDCTLSSSQADSGGGMSCYGSSPTLTGCTFLGNVADREGGGMYCSSSSPTITDCTFSGNETESVGGGGGGMWCCADSSPTLTGCTFSGNETMGYGGGSGMLCLGSSVTLTNCTLSGNRAERSGGCISHPDSSWTFENCIIAFNWSLDGEAFSCAGTGPGPTLVCCDIYGNTGGDWVGCIADEYEVNGNISENPLFCDLSSGDVALHSGSPCLPENNSCGVLLGALGAACGPVNTWHVSNADTTDIEDGSPAYPFSAIRDGLDMASQGDTVLVYEGVYFEHDIALKSGVCVTSETGLADCVTIDAQQQGRVFYCANVDSTASVVGFTVTGGLSGNGGGIHLADSSPKLTDCAFSSSQADSGGGMSCYDSSPTLTGCTFWSNVASRGGGGMYCTNSSPTITDCTFSGNQSEGPGTGHGGGMWCSGSSPGLTDCTFSGNEAKFGGGMACDASASPTLTSCTFSDNVTTSSGGGMSCLSSSPMLTDCAFSGNVAIVGGGIKCSSSSPTLTDCAFSGNVADIDGGGIQCSDSSPALLRCTFSSNATPYGYGGGISCSDSSPTLLHCTFSGNEAESSYGGAMFFYGSSSPTIENCIIAFSSSGSAVHCLDVGSEPVLACCDIYGNAGGDWVGCIAEQNGVDGNICEDPLFCDASNGDLTLRSDSPCTTAACGLMGASGVGCAAPPDIDVSPLSLEFVIEGDPTRCDTIGITNSGGTELTWSVSESNELSPARPRGSRSIASITRSLDGPPVLEGGEVREDVPWLTENPQSGTIPPGGNALVEVCADAALLSPGDYGCYLIVSSSDPDEPEVSVAIQLDVIWTGVHDDLPHSIAARGNYPNPFNPNTEIAYELPEQAQVSLRVYDCSGRCVRVLMDRASVEAGQHRVAWDGRDDTNRPLPSGVYFYRLAVGDISIQKAMVLVK